MTPTERHTEALETLRRRRISLSVANTQHFALPWLDHLVRTLERHAPNHRGWCLDDRCSELVVEWPCPDAQSALDAITEAGS